MINYDKYGNPTSFPDVRYQASTSNSSYRGKKAFFGGATNQSQLQRAVAQNIFSYGQMIDKSLCFCGLGEESPLSKTNYVLNSEPPVVTSEIRNVTNWFLWEKTNDATNFFNRGSLRLDNLNVFTWNTTTTVQTLQRYIEPFTIIPPKNQVLLIYVCATKDDNTDGHVFDLYEYCTNQHILYNRITSVYCAFMIGNNTPRGNNAGTIPDSQRLAYMFGLLENYHYNNNDYIAFSLTRSENLHFARFGYLPIMGALQNSTSSSHFASNDEIPIFYGETEKWTVERIDNANVRIYRDISNENIDNFYNECMHATACYGLFFTDRTDVSINGNFNDENMCLGLIDSNGIGHGNYTRGVLNEVQPQYSWYDMHQSNYTPSSTEDPTTYTNNTIFNTTSLNAPTNSFSTFWVLNDYEVQQLLRELFNIQNQAPNDKPIEYFNQTSFLTANGIDCALTFYRFPLSDVPHSTISKTIYFGKVASNLTAYPLTKNCEVYDFYFRKSGNTTLFIEFGQNFLGYEPYTKVEINIPFCGSVQIPTTYLYNYDDLRVALVVDFVTGACSAFVISNGIVIATSSGQCGVSIPLSGVQATNLDSQIFNASQAQNKNETSLVSGFLAGAASLGIGVATGGIGAIIGGALAMGATALNYEQTKNKVDYELTHMEQPLKVVNSASPQISEVYDRRCKMVVHRPIFQENFNPEIYGKTVGYACLISTTVNKLKGYTEGNITFENMTNSPTKTELDMIYNLFTNGVIL